MFPGKVDPVCVPWFEWRGEVDSGTMYTYVVKKGERADRDRDES